MYTARNKKDKTLRKQVQGGLRALKTLQKEAAARQEDLPPQKRLKKSLDELRNMQPDNYNYISHVMNGVRAVKDGADPNLQIRGGANTLLHFITRRASLLCTYYPDDFFHLEKIISQAVRHVNILIEHGAKTDTHNQQGETALNILENGIPELRRYRRDGGDIVRLLTPLLNTLQEGGTESAPTRSGARENVTGNQAFENSPPA